MSCPSVVSIVRELQKLRPNAANLPRAHGLGPGGSNITVSKNEPASKRDALIVHSALLQPAHVQ